MNGEIQENNESGGGGDDGVDEAEQPEENQS